MIVHEIICFVTYRLHTNNNNSNNTNNNYCKFQSKGQLMKKLVLVCWLLWPGFILLQWVAWVGRPSQWCRSRRWHPLLYLTHRASATPVAVLALLAIAVLAKTTSSTIIQGVSRHQNSTIVNKLLSIPSLPLLIHSWSYSNPHTHSRSICYSTFNMNSYHELLLNNHYRNKRYWQPFWKIL